MSGSKERDEQEALKLDECFRNTLERVRPCILGLSVAEDDQLCRLWLEKLRSASNQRPLRNQYLHELCRHLKSGHIGGIFGKPPSNGPLKPLSKFCNDTFHASSSLSDLSDSSSSVIHECSRRCSIKHRNKTPSRHRSIDSSSSNNCDHSIAESPALHVYEKIRFDRNQLTAHRQRIDSKTQIVKELQTQNEHLKRDLSYARENCESKENSDKLRSTIKQLTGEITSLRTKLVEVHNLKDQLERNHNDIVQQYKTTMTEELNELNEQLRETNSKNVALDEKFSSTNRRLEEIMNEKEKEIMSIEQNCKEQIESVQFKCNALLAEKDKELLLKNEIIAEKDAELAEMDKTRCEEVESLNNNVHELEEKLRTKIEEEGQIQSFIKEQCNTMKEDLTKMRTDMEIASQAQNNNLLNKISALKKTILRLEKSKEKLGIECAKKISHVLETKELEIKSLQLQLQEQRNELTTSLSSEKEYELNKLVSLLEERYKGLLSETDANAVNQRKTFLKRITILENQMTLLKHSLEFDSESTVV